MTDAGPERLQAERTKDAESVLRRLGFSKVRPERRHSVDPEATFYVQEPGFPRRTFPVFVPTSTAPELSDRIGRWLETGKAATSPRRRAIFVAPSDSAAEEAWAQLGTAPTVDAPGSVSILVLPRGTSAPGSGHFHLRRASPAELLKVATGIVVGLFRRAQASDGSSPIDFEEMLEALRAQFDLDVHRSLGVDSDEDALYLLYQLALRDTYAPGDGGANLHTLVLKPTGPAARLPWFAA